MKKLLFINAILALSLSSLHAQKDNWHKKRISPTLFENYMSLPQDKNVKNGAYNVANVDNKVLVLGSYKNNVKDSIWNFYNITGDIIQSYNYSTNQMLYHVVDPSTIVKQKVVIDTTLSEDDKIVAPQKIGGVNYGFYLIHSDKALPVEVKQQKNDILMEYVFSLSETGKLTDWHIVYTSTFFNDDRKQSISGLPKDAYEFTAATVNGKPIKSVLIYQVMLYVNQARDKGTYNVVTQQNQ
ncbi:MAG: hypothetical protein WCI80_02980 [Bacteroidota bacterium]